MFVYTLGVIFMGVARFGFNIQSKGGFMLTKQGQSSTRGQTGQNTEEVNLTLVI